MPITADDARDSGVVDETGDFVVSLFRPDQLVVDANGTQPLQTGSFHLGLLKSRHGGQGRVFQLRLSLMSLAIADAYDKPAITRIDQENRLVAQGVHYDDFRKARNAEVGQRTLAGVVAMKPGELYDLLQELFGIGDFDDGQGLWYQSRGVEIGKLKRMLTSRHCTVEEVAEAARYAHGRHIPITQAWQVFQLVPEALRARRLSRAEEEHLALRDARSEAVRAALDLHDTTWADRLMRTPDQHLETVLQEWRNHARTLHP